VLCRRATLLCRWNRLEKERGGYKFVITPNAAAEHVFRPVRRTDAEVCVPRLLNYTVTQLDDPILGLP